MMYLEDYLELLEYLPQEVRAATDHIRDLDSAVQKSSELVNEQAEIFFAEAKKMKTDDKQSNYDKIKREHNKIISDSEEKLKLITKAKANIERYANKLDCELEKFKCELEADSPGITEILEQKSLELDEPVRDNKDKLSLSSRASSNLNNMNDWKTTPTIKKEDPEFSFIPNIDLSPPPSATYSLNSIGSGNNVIAAAASTAIAATQQIRQGRKSTLPSYDNLSHGVFSTDLLMGNEIAYAAKAALAASSLSQDSGASNSSSASLSAPLNPKKQKKNKGSSSISSLSREISPMLSEDLPVDSVIDPLSENVDWLGDPNEPRYCLCNQISYGDMVACDNPKCPLEWFHYPCVEITSPPKGKWYCPKCRENRKQKK